MVTVFDCSFVRAGLLTIKRELDKHAAKERFGRFQNVYNNVTGVPEFDETNFRSNLSAFYNFVRRKRFHGKVAAEFSETFAVTRWSKLSIDLQNKHNLLHCIQCQTDFPELHGSFPSNKRKRKAVKGKTTVNLELTTPVSVSSAEDVELASELIRSTCRAWSRVNDSSLEKLIPKVLQLTPRKTTQEKRNILRKQQRKVKLAMEATWRRNDTITVYGTRQSLSSYEKQRKFLSMEPFLFN